MALNCDSSNIRLSIMFNMSFEMYRGSVEVGYFFFFASPLSPCNEAGNCVHLSMDLKVVVWEEAPVSMGVASADF